MNTLVGKLGWVICVLMILGACAAADTSKYTNYKEDVGKRAEEMRKGPETPPRPSDTGFAQALRCMDSLFVTYGIKDLSVLVEDLPDPTKKVNAGGKDMLISAVSQMTRRSRAVRLVAYSYSDYTLRDMLKENEKKMESLPRYTIRGSISQYDESMMKKQGDAGFTLGPFSIGKAKQGSASVLGLDLNVIETASLMLEAGVTSRNSVLLLREGEGMDGDLTFNKFGLNYNFTISKTEGNAQALRTLAELASIELFGKLTKTPYWICLGSTDAEEAVQSEISDWWETLAGDPTSLGVYFQTQMRTRGLYKGPSNGMIDDALIQALGIYQRVLGIPESGSLDREFFKRYLAADHAKLQKEAQAYAKTLPPVVATAPEAPAAPASSGKSAVAASEAPATLPGVVVGGSKGQAYVYRRGEPYQIDVVVDRDASLYCFLVDENRKVSQFFPNLMQQSAAVRAGTRLSFPGSFPFKFVANSKGETETVTCFASTARLGAQPLSSLPLVRDPSELTSAFRGVAGAGFTTGRFDVRVQ